MSFSEEMARLDDEWRQHRRRIDAVVCDPAFTNGAFLSGYKIAHYHARPRDPDSFQAAYAKSMQEMTHLHHQVCLHAQELTALHQHRDHSAPATWQAYPGDAAPFIRDLEHLIHQLSAHADALRPHVPKKHHADMDEPFATFSNLAVPLLEALKEASAIARRVQQLQRPSETRPSGIKPGYKQTEVGVIPEEWEVKRLGDLGNVVRGGSPRPAGDARYFNGNFIPWLTVGSLTNIPTHQLFVTDTATKLTEAGSHLSRTLQDGTLVMVNSGARTLGVSKVLAVTCCANDGIAALVNQSAGDKRFLCLFLNSQIRRLREVVAAGNDQLNLNTGRIALISVPFPKEAEQRAIAAALSDVDGLLGGLDRLIAKKRDLKQAAMQQLLTGQTRLPGFHGEWEVKRLGEVGKFLKGSGVTKDQTRSGSLACVRYGELYTLHHDVVRGFQSWISPEVAATAVRLKQGDILFAGSGETKAEIGKCAAFVSDIEAYAGGDIVILRPDNCDSLFLGYYLNTSPVAQQKASRGQGDAVVHISSSALSDIRCKLPPLAEQTAIAAVLSEMDGELGKLEERREKTRALKQAMMQELLTGRTRLV